MDKSIVIRKFEKKDAPAACKLFDSLCGRGELVYSPLAQDAWDALFLMETGRGFVAQKDGALIGFAHGSVKDVFLGGETAGNTPAYLTCVLVEKAYRRQGVGRALLSALSESFRQDGKTRLVCSGDNPAHLAWRIPGAHGHDHNNAPGVDEDCEGYGFLQKLGFHEDYHEVSMYRALDGYQLSDETKQKQRELLAQGIRVGRYDLSLGDEYDGMCDRVGSEYWRNVLKTELQAWKDGKPNQDPSLWPDGREPKAPRVLLTATTNGHIAGFTGPVDKQNSGRGWFTGICTDPDYGGRGIATVLFGLLLDEFVKEDAAFVSLFTGKTNHAQKIYARAGLKPVRSFCVMSIPLLGEGADTHKYF